MKRRSVLGLLSLALGLLGSAPSRAASAGRGDPIDQLEDRLVDRDIDAEDLASMRAPRPFALSGSRTSAYVALSAFLRHQADGQQETGALLVLQLPIDRIFRPARPAGDALSLSPSGSERALGSALPEPARAAPSEARAILQQAAPAPAPAPAPSRTSPSPASAIVVSSEVARACVRAALRAMGLGDEARIESLASRARASAALPDLRLRALRSVDESGRLTFTEADPNRYTETGATGYGFEGRVTFRLDRLLFADEEVSLERIRLDRLEVRTRIAAKALQLLFEWQRAYGLEQNPALPTDEHFDAVLREIEAAATLDVMTDGWFSKWRASLAPALDAPRGQ